MSSKTISISTGISVSVLALVALNNATSTDSLLPLSIVAAAGLIAMGLASRKNEQA